MAWGVPRVVGLILFVFAIIPVGDMLVILAAKGSTKSAFGMHGLAAVQSFVEHAASEMPNL